MTDAPFKPDLQAFIRSAPNLVLILEPDFTVVAVNDALLHATNTKRGAVIGRNIFEAFPDNPQDPEADGTANLRASLERVLKNGVADRLDTQRYDVRRAPEDGGGFECRYWNAFNYPVLDAEGTVRYIVHQSEEVTELVELRRREAERVAELAEVNSQFQAVYDQGLFAGRLDLEGRLTDANRSSLVQCGFTREDVIGKLFWECGWWNRSVEVQARIRAAVKQAIGGQAFREESTYFLADGTERIVDFACMPIRDDARNIPFLMVTGIDITERTRAALDQRATEILENITDGFFALDRLWRFTYMNRQGQRILARHDLLGKVIWDCYPGLDGTGFERSYRRTMSKGEATSFTSYYPGHDRWYEVHAYPAPEGISVYFRDVTERKQAEAERERLVTASEKQRLIYEAALSNTPDLVYVFDLDHRFIYANEALLTMWGRTRADALGKTCLELGYEPWHAEMHGSEIEQVVATRRPIRGEVPFTGTGGRRIYDYIFVPVIGADGEVVAVAGTTRDVTERQQAEQEIRAQAEQLRESDRAKDEFLATLAHELRNPLAPVVNSLELLKRAPANAALASQAHSTMERQVRHLVHLVDDLLDVSRITQGRLELRRERVPLSSIVEQVLEACGPHIEAAGHALSVSIPDAPIHVDADPVRLVQILGNLLNNASRYTPRGGRIGLSVTSSDGHVQIRIRDSGVGIAPEMIERIFDMFTRADQSIERAQDGLGVGLTLAQRLALLHGGGIEAHSDGLGDGSEFTVTLPLAREAKSASSSRSSR